MEKVAFQAGRAIFRDEDSTPYGVPHWQREPARRYPYLYRRDRQLEIGNATWKLEGNFEPTAEYRVKGTGSDDIDIPETVAELNGDELSINDVRATKAFPNETRYYAPFEIQWKISCNGGDWVDAGKSRNEIYVSLDWPSSTSFRYRTVVHLACSNDQAEDEQDAFDKTWSLFSGPGNVNGWNKETSSWSRKLYYYKWPTAFDDNGEGSGAMFLLQNDLGTGNCATWAWLLKDALGINNITTGYVFATPVNGNVFLVKNWEYHSSSLPDPGEWKFLYPGSDNDMMLPALPPNNRYGDLENLLNGISGQNSTPPSQKVFDNHQFLSYNGPSGKKYYDPSYGVEYTGEQDFQKQAIAGYGQYGTIEEGKLTMKVWKPPQQGHNIHFSET